MDTFIPKRNDSDEELNNIAKFIAGVGKDIPWHISRFHPDYKYTDSYPTPIEILKKAQEIGEKHGLHYIYLGNVHAGLDTKCHKCSELLIKREYMGTDKINIEDGKCPNCGTIVGGIF